MMKQFMLVKKGLLAFMLLISSGLALAATDNMKANMPDMERMQKMDQMMERISDTNDPQAHREMMGKHMQMMHQSMAAMKEQGCQPGSMGMMKGKGMADQGMNHMPMMRHMMDQMHMHMKEFDRMHPAEKK